MKRLRWSGLAGAAIVALTLLFLGRTIASQWQELRLHDWSADPLRLLASIIALGIVFVWGVWTWRLILRHLGVRVALGPLVRIWFISSLARYVPGKVWQFVGAAGLGRRAGLPPVPLVTSMIIQTAFLLASATVLGLPFLLFAFAGDRSPALLLLATAVGVAIAAAAVHPAVLNTVLRLVPRALHREVIRWTGSWRSGLLLLGLFVISWIGNGLAFALFVSAVVDVPAGAVPALVAINAISVAAGVLVFVVPAGLGAREAILALLLAPYAKLTAIAALLAVLSRLWILATELAGAVISGGWDALRPGSEDEGPGVEDEEGPDVEDEEPGADGATSSSPTAGGR